MVYLISAICWLIPYLWVTLVISQQLPDTFGERNKLDRLLVQTPLARRDVAGAVQVIFGRDGCN